LTSKCLRIHFLVRNPIVSFDFRILFLEWTMRTILPIEERLKSLPFPESSASNSIENPVEVSFKIPPYVYIGNDITALKIGVWDAAKQEWTSDNISYGKEESKKDHRQINFTTTKFAPMAMLQSRCMDYPYQNWWLRCIKEDTALLDLWTKRVKLVFEITPLTIKLLDSQV